MSPEPQVLSALPDCIFCRIVSGEIAAPLVYEDELTIAFNDVNPVAPVHVLVIPRAHSPAVKAIDDAGLAALLHSAHQVAALKGVAESGYRLVFNLGDDGGQTVFHTHLHVLGGRRMTWPPG